MLQHWSQDLIKLPLGTLYGSPVEWSHVYLVGDLTRRSASARSLCVCIFAPQRQLARGDLSPRCGEWLWVTASPKAPFSTPHAIHPHPCPLSHEMKDGLTGSAVRPGSVGISLQVGAGQSRAYRARVQQKCLTQGRAPGGQRSDLTAGGVGGVGAANSSQV